MKYTPYGCITQATLCGLSPHGELALQANARLTPYLKLGGCASALLKKHRQELPDVDRHTLYSKTFLIVAKS